MLKKTEGIVLRSRDYGEAHKILTILTPEGKIAVMARGARRGKSRFGAVSQPLTHGYFVYYARDLEHMGTLNQGEVLHSYYQMATNLYLQAYAMYFLECADQVTEDGYPWKRLYPLLFSVLNMLEKGKPPEILRLIFDLVLLDISGYRPVWDRCVHCGLPAASDASQTMWLVSPPFGGLLCLSCQRQDRRALAVSPKVAGLLSFLQDFPVGRLGEVKLNPHTVQQLKRIVAAFTEEHLALQLKSLAFLEQITTE